MKDRNGKELKIGTLVEIPDSFHKGRIKYGRIYKFNFDSTEALVTDTGDFEKWNWGAWVKSEDIGLIDSPLTTLEQAVIKAAEEWEINRHQMGSEANEASDACTNLSAAVSALQSARAEQGKSEGGGA